MTDKLLAKWMIMRVDDVRDHGTASLMSLIGIITQSNFMPCPRNYEMPVLLQPMQGINTGDTVKLTYYTRESKVQAHPDGTLGFADEGLRYEKLVNDCWELIYEDFPEQLDP